MGADHEGQLPAQGLTTLAIAIRRLVGALLGLGQRLAGVGRRVAAWPWLACGALAMAQTVCGA